MRDLDKILTSWKRAFRERSEAYERTMSRTLVLLLQRTSASLAHGFFSNVHAMGYPQRPSFSAHCRNGIATMSSWLGAS